MIPKIKSFFDTADIVLLLEGTYPYVRGGVSSWVHQIISGLPDYKFALVFLGAVRGQYGKMGYELPKNVVHLENHYIMEPLKGADPKPRPGRARLFKGISMMHDFFRKPELGMPKEVFENLARTLASKTGITKEDFLHSESAWDEICGSFRKYCTDPSFVDFFWTIRTMHAPVFLLAEIARKVPQARVFHSVSTGYAGLLGLFLSQLQKKPFILTEHGIYTKERKIDLSQADWIHDKKGEFGGGLFDSITYLRDLWIHFFEGIGRLIYEGADPIISITEGNRARQIKDGADAKKTQVISNAINLERLRPLRFSRPMDTPPILGLVGRVVPIKDIMTFIRTMRTVCSQLPEAEGWIIGPEEENPDYVRDCKDLVKSLELEDNVKFLGFQKVDEILPNLGILILTSISEALPLVILEGFATGLPALATDVGGCRELIEGSSEEDKALGSAGAVVQIADPEATAEAAIALLTDKKRWSKAQETAIQRVERYYNEEMLFDKYFTMYEEAIAK